jgi:proteasome lid subunit RPN8/RPN11
MTLRIKQSCLDAVEAHARKWFPMECCGLIAGSADGSVKTVCHVYCLNNADKSSEHFSIDPVEQLAAVRDMRKAGVAPLGNFHSHPETPPRPSEEDIRLARDPSASYMILSLADGTARLRSFHIENGVAAPEEIEII